MIANYTLLIYLVLRQVLLREISLNIIIDAYNIVLKLSIGPTLEQRKRTNVFRQTDFTNVHADTFVLAAQSDSQQNKITKSCNLSQLARVVKKRIVAVCHGVSPFFPPSVVSPSLTQVPRAYARSLIFAQGSVHAAFASLTVTRASASSRRGQPEEFLFSVSFLCRQF